MLASQLALPKRPVSPQQRINQGRFTAFKPEAEQIIPMSVAKEYIITQANLYKETVAKFKANQTATGEALDIIISNYITTLRPAINEATITHFGDTLLTKPITDGITVGILVQLRKIFCVNYYSAKFFK